MIDYVIAFLGLTEMWLTSSSPEAVITIPGHDVFRKYRAQGKGGLIYVKDTLKWSKIEWSDDINLECVGVDMIISTEISFTVICIYLKPSATINYYSHLKTLQLNLGNSKEEIILIGQ